MKQLGLRKTRSAEGHQECGVCHPLMKNHKARERERVKREIKEILEEVELSEEHDK